MTQEAKVLLGIGIVTLIILIGGVFFLSNSNPPTTSSGAIDASILVQKESQKMGNESAKITLVEFSDFQCPYCAATYMPVKEIMKKYNKDVLFVFRHFPLSGHKNAMVAAMAAEAAGAQGKFWEMHDMLFDNQGNWGESETPIELFKTYAQKLNLNVEQFTKEVTEEKYLAKIQNDREDGNKARIAGTPTFFLNGEKVVGYNSPSELQSLLEKLIENKLQ